MQYPSPRVLLISQWPKTKNAEFELIAKIRKTDAQITVVDYLGFDVDSGVCLNTADLDQNFDFAIALHYDTPKFLNIPTYYWVANPLEFMYLRHDYRDVIIHHLRSYDEYLYNGSSFIKDHIHQVVGRDWTDSELQFYASSAVRGIEPVRSVGTSEEVPIPKVFYCGINWERGIDPSGRAHGILQKLESSNLGEFYGPNLFEGYNPWIDYHSYRGEIPFDGSSMTAMMRKYIAVLALSSPAHLRSQTSSSRVFEGLSAGVPVISDLNPHVVQLFGDLVYYFQGADEDEQIESIQGIVGHILANPNEARDKVAVAQTLIREKYSFEVSFAKILRYQEGLRNPGPSAPPSFAIFLIEHDPYRIETSETSESNLGWVSRAATVAATRLGSSVRVIIVGAEDRPGASLPTGSELVVWERLTLDSGSGDPRTGYLLGQKVSRLVASTQADLCVVWNQDDFPHHDNLLKVAAWYARERHSNSLGLFVSGFFENDLSQVAPQVTHGIVRNNVTSSLYRWTQSSLIEHQLGTLWFSKEFRASFPWEKIVGYDVLLPIAIRLMVDELGGENFVSPSMTLRVSTTYWKKHHAAWEAMRSRGFWPQHYGMLSNYNHELNKLVDTFVSSHEIQLRVDQLSGRFQQVVNNSRSQTDPAVFRVDRFIRFLMPIYLVFKPIVMLLKLVKRVLKSLVGKTRRKKP